MQTQDLGPYDYDELQACPFCIGVGLLSGDNCPHFLTAFEVGVWGRNICPPVSCDGFLYQRRELTTALAESPGIVCKAKSGTTRHPYIEAYFADDPALVAALQERFCKEPVPSARCPTCGNETAVVGEDDDILCALCGESTEPTALSI